MHSKIEQIFGEITDFTVILKMQTFTQLSQIPRGRFFVLFCFAAGNRVIFFVCCIRRFFIALDFGLGFSETTYVAIDIFSRNAMHQNENWENQGDLRELTFLPFQKQHVQSLSYSCYIECLSESFCTVTEKERQRDNSVQAYIRKQTMCQLCE